MECSGEEWSEECNVSRLEHGRKGPRVKECTQSVEAEKAKMEILPESLSETRVGDPQQQQKVKTPMHTSGDGCLHTCASNCY